MTETVANGYSSESAQQELSNEYQHGRVLMVLKNLCILVLWAEVATALEGLKCTDGDDTWKCDKIVSRVSDLNFFVQMFLQIHKGIVYIYVFVVSLAWWG